jgi:hypothetical protein
MIYTAQYRLTGPNRLDITVKGNNILGKWLAPTWDMVKAYKRTGNAQIYTQQYFQLLGERYALPNGEGRQAIDRIASIAINDDVTFVCFCSAGNFCHRYLAVDWLKHYWPQIVYKGEIQ